jgi:hypothetical protein
LLLAFHCEALFLFSLWQTCLPLRVSVRLTFKQNWKQNRLLKKQRPRTDSSKALLSLSFSRDYLYLYYLIENQSIKVENVIKMCALTNKRWHYIDFLGTCRFTLWQGFKKPHHPFLPSSYPFQPNNFIFRPFTFSYLTCWFPPFKFFQFNYQLFIHNLFFFLYTFLFTPIYFLFF